MTNNNHISNPAMHKPENLEGVWGAIARRFDEPGSLAHALVSELDEGLALLGNLPAAATFFGGARIEEEDEYYHAACKMGEILAHKGIPPRTGAGPGIMSAVPEGFRKKLFELGEISPEEAAREAAKAVFSMSGNGCEPVTGRARMLTQGFNIQLPFEQSINPAIDVSLELTHFPTRKLVLWKNALGLIVFPGGFGTLDELLEVWRHKQRGRLDLPIILYGRDFWEELHEGIRAASINHSNVSITQNDLDLIHLTDDPEEALSKINPTGFENTYTEDLAKTGRRIAKELVEALQYLEQLEPAVTFLGGSLHEETDECIKTAEVLAENLARHNVPTRAGGPGALSIALARGGRRGRENLIQQGFGLHRDDITNIYKADKIHIVKDRLTHKVLLTENARAFVALPGSIGTLDELFSILCQLQTNKIPHRRVILIGSTFWKPIWKSLASQMLHGKRKTISPEDLELVTITDNPDDALELCMKPPEQRAVYSR